MADTLAQVKKDIASYKRKLIANAKRYGVRENFGRREVRKLYDEYSNYYNNWNGVWQEIAHFDEWCANYTGKE